jgi:hypothetical protein
MHLAVARGKSGKPASYAFVLTVVALGLASLGQSFLNRRDHEGSAVILLLSAVLLVVVAFRRVPGDEGGSRQASTTRWHWRGMLALLLASLPAWAGAWILSARWDKLLAGASLYLVGLGLALAVCGWRDGWRLSRPAHRRHWAEFSLVVSVLALGLFLLLYRLDQYPPPRSISWNDEAQIGKDAYGVIYHGYQPWQFPISVYSTAISFLTFGPTVLALRLPFVLMGFLTLVAFYLLVGELFRFPVALATTFLFAVSRWHIAFSRLVLPSTPAMLLEVSTLYLLLRGRRTRGMANYVLAGFTLGLGLYTHASFRIVPILVLVLFAYEGFSWWQLRRKAVDGRMRAPLAGLLMPWLVFVASVAVFALPLASMVWRDPHVAFGERFTSVMPALFAPGGALQQDGLMERAQRLLGFFNYKGESWGAVNLPDLPMLDPFTGVLFALGLGCCLFYIWRNSHFFYLAWFLGTLIGGGLLTVDLRSHRFAGLMPVLFIFAGVFIDGALKTLEMAFGPRRRGYFGLVLIPMLVLAGWSNYQLFFHRQVFADSVRIEFTREITAVANYIADLGEGQYVYLFANYPYYSPGMDFAWIAAERPGERATDVLDVVPSHRDIEDGDLVYIFVSPYDVQALAAAVRDFYPQAIVETFEGEYDRYTFTTVRVAAEEVEAAQGLLGYYYSDSALQGLPQVVRRERQINLDWDVVDPPLSSTFSAEWRGILYAPQDGEYILEIEPMGLCHFRVDEVMVMGAEPLRLVKGGHELQVACPELTGDGPVRLLWTTPGRVREVVPAQFLAARERVNGILVSAFKGPDWQGEPVERSIQPVLSLLSMPTAWQSGFTRRLAGELYSLDCRGQLEIRQPGSYSFHLMPWNGEAVLWIDGTRLAMLPDGSARTRSGMVELGSGWHDLRLLYSYHGGEFSGVEVLWTPPGGETQTIPPGLLRPVGQVVRRPSSPAP